MTPTPQSQPTRFRTEGDVNASDRRTQWQDEHLDNATHQLLAEDATYFLHQALSTPCLNVVRQVDGIYLEDLQGRRIMDFHGNSVHQVGFSNPTVIDAIKQQLDELSFSTRRYTNRTAVDLAKKLTELAPGRLNRVLFAPSGALAIGMALKLARIVTGRHKTISMWESFHGASLDAISIGGSKDFRYEIGPLLPGTEHVPPPEEYRCLWGCGERGGCDLKCADYIEYILDRERDIAAIVVETVRSTPSFPTPAFWQRVRALCDRYGALLILDEIPWCLGRTGKMFACEHYDLEPDILVIGKGLGGGILPLAAMIAREDLNVAADRSIGHYTHEKNPVLCAAALATIRYIEEHDLLAHAHRLGEHALARMQRMAAQYAIIGDVRGLGLMLGMELVRDRQSKEPATDEAEAVMYAALTQGLSFKLTRGNIITLMPPLTVTQAELDRALDIVERCIAELS
ncbi:MAG TPA: aspartate aminotransferase family protein [Caldilineaceae bacterium]|nr:aspartate aminotransferase family protein [Caldilineaceae bacterium]